MRALYLLLLLILFCVPRLSLAQGQVHLILSSQNGIFSTVHEKISQRVAQLNAQLHIGAHLLDQPWQQGIAPSDLLVAVGAKAAKALIHQKLPNPILFVFVESPLLADILPHENAPSWAAVVVDQPLERLVSVAQLLRESESYRKKMLLVVSDDNDVMLEQVERLTQSQRQNLEVILIEAGEVAAKVIEPALFNAAAVIAVKDKQVWSGNNARWMLRQAYAFQVPVIGYSKAFLKAGALISAYSTLDQLVDRSAKMITQWESAGGFTDPGIHYADYQVEVNKSIARALRVDVDRLEGEP